MCGIFAYIGNQDAVDVCLAGLKKLEYRGYDSSGIAGVRGGALFLCKKIGNISALESVLKNEHIQLHSAISHTRWATHGKPSEQNAHPHIDQKKTVAVVHNGIIENYAILRESLEKQRGVQFASETDTEVIAQNVAHHYQGNFLEAVKLAFSQLEGSFAVALIHKDHPNQIIAVAKESPLVIGFSKTAEESFVASDPSALSGKELDLYYLTRGEIAVLEKGKSPLFFDSKGLSLSKTPVHLYLNESAISKVVFKHFMLKEICEQAASITHALAERFDEGAQRVYFKELEKDRARLKTIEHIIIIGCGTSWHAAYVASYFLEEISQIATRIEIASEFRYRKAVILPNTLVLVLSQSGETADTIAALRIAKPQAAYTLALCNVPGSTVTREVDATIFLHSGPEVAVASTKTFTAQVSILYLLTLFFSEIHGMDKNHRRILLKHLYEIPEQVAEILNRLEEIQILAKKYAKAEHFFFLGRNILYPAALEAALKLKEIAYIDATGYPAGEMKHGPIALLSKELPVAIFCANKELQPKIMSNLMESKARGSPIIVFGWKEFEKEVIPVANDCFWIPKTSDELAPVLLTVATQLFAYYVALERGASIDQPKNLAKSVTVE